MSESEETTQGTGLGLLVAVCLALLAFGGAVHWWTAHAPEKPPRPVQEARTPREVPSDRTSASSAAAEVRSAEARNTEARSTGPPPAPATPPDPAATPATEPLVVEIYGLRVVYSPKRSDDDPAAAASAGTVIARGDDWIIESIEFREPVDPAEPDDPGDPAENPSAPDTGRLIGTVAGCRVEARPDGSVAIHLPEGGGRLEGWPTLTENAFALARSIHTGKPDPRFLREALAAWGRAHAIESIRVDWDREENAESRIPLTIDLERTDPR